MWRGDNGAGPCSAESLEHLRMMAPDATNIVHDDGRTPDDYDAELEGMLLGKLLERKVRNDRALERPLLSDRRRRALRRLNRRLADQIEAMG